MNFDLRQFIPFGLVFPFLLIIFIELALGWGLDFYQQQLNTQINNLETQLNQKEAELSGKLSSNEAYFVFSQLVNLVEILKTKRSLNFVIDKFNQLMPKFLVIKNFDFDAEKNEISFEASVAHWNDYIRFHRYLTNHSDLELRSYTSPRLEKNQINFSMVLYLKPSFYK